MDLHRSKILEPRWRRYVRESIFGFARAADLIFDFSISCARNVDERASGELEMEKPNTRESRANQPGHVSIASRFSMCRPLFQASNWICFVASFDFLFRRLDGRRPHVDRRHVPTRPLCLICAWEINSSSSSSWIDRFLKLASVSRSSRAYRCFIFMYTICTFGRHAVRCNISLSSADVFVLYFSWLTNVT